MAICSSLLVYTRNTASLRWSEWQFTCQNKVPGMAVNHY